MDFPCSFSTWSPSTARSEHAKTLRLRSDFEGFSYLSLARFLGLYPDSRCGAALENAKVCGPIFDALNFPRAMKNHSKIELKSSQNRHQN